MAYCIKCGVELGAGEQRCPLCHTPVLHPDVTVDPTQKPFPTLQRQREEPVSRSGVLFILTMLFVLPLAIAFLCDFLFHEQLTWFPYVASSMGLGYIVLILPLWFQRPNPVVFSCVDFVATAGFLLYLDLLTDGGWFLPFALPVTGGAMLITVTVVCLCRYVRKGYLYIFGGAILATGVYAVLIELLINVVFRPSTHLVWSWFPLAACIIVGTALIVIAICPRLRESLHKKFFL